MIPAHANGRPDVAGCLAEPVRLIEGAVYRFAGIGEGAGKRLPDNHPDAPGQWKYRPGLYRFLAVAAHTRTWQEVVVYQGLTGADAGRVYVCPLEDFARNFKLAANPPPPEKVVDHRVHGSGV